MYMGKDGAQDQYGSWIQMFPGQVDALAGYREFINQEIYVPGNIDVSSMYN